MNIKTRRNCASCRLAKCLSVGMSADFIRKEELQSRKYRSLSKSKFPVVKQEPVCIRYRMRNLRILVHTLKNNCAFHEMLLESRHPKIVYTSK